MNTTFLQWTEHIFAVFGMVVFAVLMFFFLTYETVPTSNCKLTHFDTIIVLGSPALLNGQPSPEQRERVIEGVREFRAGRARHMIFTGGAAQNQFVEAQVMAGVAAAAGVPPEDLLIEGDSKNTIQNVFFCNRIMNQNGWTSAEVVSSPSHLPRAGLILQHYEFRWKEHAAPWPREYSAKQLALVYLTEAIETTKLRWWGFDSTQFLPN